MGVNGRRDRVRRETLEPDFEEAYHAIIAMFEFHYDREVWDDFVKVRLRAILAGLGGAPLAKEPKATERTKSAYIPDRQAIELGCEAAQREWSSDTREFRRSMVPGDYQPVV